MATDNNMSKIVAEEATGIRQRGCLEIYKARPLPEECILPEDVLPFMLEGGRVDVPAAGAGSAREFAELVSIGELLEWDTTSSAGNWCYVCPALELCLVQTNRYPYRGFTYALVQMDTAMAEHASEHNAEVGMRRSGWITADEALDTMSAVKAMAKEAAEEAWDNLERELRGSAMFVNVLTWDVMSGLTWSDLARKVQPDVE